MRNLQHKRESSKNDFDGIWLKIPCLCF